MENECKRVINTRSGIVNGGDEDSAAQGRNRDLHSEGGRGQEIRGRNEEPAKADQKLQGEKRKNGRPSTKPSKKVKVEPILRRSIRVVVETSLKEAEEQRIQNKKDAVVELSKADYACMEANPCKYNHPLYRCAVADLTKATGESYLCDVCNAEIDGSIFCCLACDDYDICRSCAMDTEDQNGEQTDGIELIDLTEPAEISEQVNIDDLPALGNDDNEDSAFLRGLDQRRSVRFVEQTSLKEAEAHRIQQKKVALKELSKGNAASMKSSRCKCVQDHPLFQCAVADLTEATGESYLCDACDVEIDGSMFSCLVCDEYDICKSCAEKTEDQNTEQRDGLELVDLTEPEDPAGVDSLLHRVLDQIEQLGEMESESVPIYSRPRRSIRLASLNSYEDQLETQRVEEQEAVAPKRSARKLQRKPKLSKRKPMKLKSSRKPKSSKRKPRKLKSSRYKKGVLPPGIRKSNERIADKEQFYTKRVAVDKCLKFYDKVMPTSLKDELEFILEPSAGTGAFLKGLARRGVSKSSIISYDIDPKHPDIEKADFLKTEVPMHDCVCVGNVPFGRNNSMSVPFFKQSAKYCRIIAWVVPMSWKKQNIRNRLPKNFHLYDQIDMPRNPFEGHNSKQSGYLKTVFQIWVRYDPKDKPLRPYRPLQHHFFEVKTRKTLKSGVRSKFIVGADLSIITSGYGCGKMVLLDKKQHFRRSGVKTYIHVDEDVIDKLYEIDFSRYSNNTATIESLSQLDIETELEKVFLDKQFPAEDFAMGFGPRPVGDTELCKRIHTSTWD